MGRAILLIVLLLSSKSFAFESCSYLFNSNSIEDLYSKHTGFYYGFTSPIDSHVWWVDQIYNQHLKEKIQNSDPVNGHIETLSFILDEVLRYAVLSILPPYEFSWMIQPLGENRIDSLKEISKQDSNVQRGLFQAQLYLFLKAKLEEHQKNKNVSYYFYHAMSEMVTMIYAPDSTLRGDILLQLSKKYFEAEIKGNNTFFKDEFDNVFADALKQKPDIIILPYYARLDFFDFVDLLPDVSPMGIAMTSLVKYDNIEGYSPDFRIHDIGHAQTFERAYNDLTDAEKSDFKDAIHFLREYRSRLSEEEKIIFGSVVFSLIHEINDLNLFSEMINPKYNTVFKEDGKLYPYYEELIVNTYSRFLDNRDYGYGIDMKLSGLEFLTKFKKTLTQMRTDYVRTH